MKETSTAYDEAFEDYSPGLLLFQDYTKAFIGDDRVALVESCAYDDSGFMPVWIARRRVADMWIDVRHDGWHSFALLGRLEKLYRELRQMAKRNLAELVTYIAQHVRR